MKYKISQVLKPVSEKNKEGHYSDVLGVAIEKEFIPSVANLNGTDLTKYSVLRKDRFAFNPMHVGRDKKLPIALYKEEIPALVSPAYNMAEITDENKFLKEYLMLIFKSEYFDHLCWFYTDGSVRGGLSWDDFSELEINIPDIEEQKKIVRQYKTIENRIDLLNKKSKTINNLINCIFDEYLTVKEVSKKPIKEFGTVITGKTPSTNKRDYYNSKDIPFVKTPDMHDSVYVINTNDFLSKLGADSQRNKYLPVNTVIVSCIGTVGEVCLTSNVCQTNQQINAVISKHPYMLYMSIKKSINELLKEGDGSTTMSNVSKSDFEEIKIDSFEENEINSFEEIASKLFNYILIIEKEIKSLEYFKTIIVGGQLCHFKNRI